MREIYEDGTEKVFCDRCSKELTDEVISITAGDVFCKECFEKEYRILPVDDYLKGEQDV